MKSTKSSRTKLWKFFGVVLFVFFLSKYLYEKNETVKVSKVEDIQQEQVIEKITKKEQVTLEETSIKPIIYVKELAGKNILEVEQILGKPVRSRVLGDKDKVHSDPMNNYYRNDYISMFTDYGRVAISFIDGKANRITLNTTNDEYKIIKREELSALLGLPNIKLEQHGTYKYYFANKVEGFYEVIIEDYGEWASITVITDKKYN
ncbi:hypothetical protein GC093_01850 [Paenibacillus sp. LMG 31456]|uniref:DUF4309 domain-containing protein n=1 Tax=Paenibacillus foliorum TaxID=2654974 RepID=A0A972GSK0_9BACL|nr:hypothetical protein [Paenibacillus foliorum]NOU91980.1 hypothetical protein [Paenibacillus foliorum]